MSVLIKGMELPEDCANCIFKINKHYSGDEWYYACALNSKDIFEDEKGRLQDCPLIEMPEFNIIKKAPTGCVALMKHQQWVPCSERLPEEDTDVLICYRYKQDEGDTSNIKIDITSYGTVCLGGRAIQFLKEWREPFAFFHLNYEVIAWMPLPEPYNE